MKKLMKYVGIITEDEAEELKVAIKRMRSFSVKMLRRKIHASFQNI